MKPTGLRASIKYNRRRKRMRGAEMVEFTLNFLPFMVMILITLDTGWAIFTQSTLQQAVRMACREGVTLTTQSTDSNNNLIISSGGSLTGTVKALVQQHSSGILGGSTGLAYIKVHYFDRTNPSTDVSSQASGNNPGNIMQVSVEGYSLSPLIARFFSWKGGVDKTPMSITVYSADAIEPMGLSIKPAIGVAP